MIKQILTLTKYARINEMFESNVTPEKQDALLKRMHALRIIESDLEEKFILGSGKGGQKQNKTASCVYIKHKPSKTEVKCQSSRKRALNRFFARRLICEKLEEQQLGTQSPKNKKTEKLRKQKQRRKRRQRANQENKIS